MIVLSATAGVLVESDWRPRMESHVKRGQWKSALALLQTGTRSWFGRRDARAEADLEYRTCATSTKADAKAAAERMIGRRETYMSGGAI